MMKLTTAVRARGAAVAAAAAVLAVPAPAAAAGSNMPWEQPLQQILQSIEGPVTKVVAVGTRFAITPATTTG